MMEIFRSDLNMSVTDHLHTNCEDDVRRIREDGRMTVPNDGTKGRLFGGPLLAIIWGPSFE